MLQGDNVLYMKTLSYLMLLFETTILTTTGGSLPHKLTNYWLHHSLPA